MAFAPTSEPESQSRIKMLDVASGDGANTSAGLETDPRWLSVQRLINTESFAKASRLASFVLYIVERSLQGRTEEITEQQIGIHVFGRPADYNPGEDNIVRQNARHLRQRLALYYQEEGRNEAIQIVVPRGGYTPQFLYKAELEAPGEIAIADSLATPVAGSQADRDRLSPRAVTEIEMRRPRPRLPAAILVGSGLVLGVLLTLLAGYGRDTLRLSRTESFRLWNALLTANRRTLVVTGDAGVNMYGNLARTQVDPWEYGSGSYLNKPDAQTPSGFTWSPFASRKYTTISDLKFVSALLQLPYVNRSRMEIRFARDITAQDLKNNNAILIGSPNYDPWIQLLDKTQTFKMVYNGTDNSISVLNRSPLKGEQTSYTWSESDPQRTGYALISLTDNLESTGKVLIVEGTTLGGVDGATDFLFDPAQMDPIIRAAMGEDGKLSNFELLLKTTLYLGVGMKATIVAERIH